MKRISVLWTVPRLVASQWRGPGFESTGLCMFSLPLHILQLHPTVQDIHVRVTGDSKLAIDEYERSSFCDRLATCPACTLPISLRKLGWTSDALLQEQTGGWMHALFDANFFFNFWEPWNINYRLLTLLVLLPGLKATVSPPLRASANYFCVEK